VRKYKASGVSSHSTPVSTLIDRYFEGNHLQSYAPPWGKVQTNQGGSSTEGGEACLQIENQNHPN